MTHNFSKKINKYVKEINKIHNKGTTTSMTLSTQTVLAWTPGSSNPGVDLCLEGARD